MTVCTPGQRSVTWPFNIPVTGQTCLSGGISPPRAFSSGNVVDHQGARLELSPDLGPAPILAAALSTQNGSDPVGLRMKTGENGDPWAFSREERSFDDELIHDEETVDLVAFDGSGSLTGVDLLLA